MSYIPVVSDITYQENYFSMSEPGVGRLLVAFSVQGVVYIALLFAIELQCVRRLWQLLTSLCRRRKLVGAIWERGCVSSDLPRFRSRDEMVARHYLMVVIQ